MSDNLGRPVILEVNAAGQGGLRDVLDGLPDTLKSGLTVLRGRITRDTAWARLEFRGERDSVDELLRRTHGRKVRK